MQNVSVREYRKDRHTRPGRTPEPRGYVPCGRLLRRASRLPPLRPAGITGRLRNLSYLCPDRTQPLVRLLRCEIKISKLIIPRVRPHPGPSATCIERLRLGTGLQPNPPADT